MRDNKIDKTLIPSLSDCIAHLEEQKKTHPDFLKEDKLQPRITEAFKGKVGEPYAEGELQKIFQEGQKRYEKSIPPGYKDRTKSKEQRKYGDLIIWHQIISKSEEEKKPIIFITEDGKEDWWHTWNKNKIGGPCPELVQEFFEKTGEMFYMYGFDKFMERIPLYSDEKMEMENEVISDIVNLRKSKNIQRESDTERIYKNQMLIEIRNEKLSMLRHEKRLLHQIEKIDGEISFLAYKIDHSHANSELVEEFKIRISRLDIERCDIGNQLSDLSNKIIVLKNREQVCLEKLECITSIESNSDY